MRDLIRKMTPQFLLERYRKSKKNQRNKELEANRVAGDVITLESLVKDIKACGVVEGDTVLVHSSLSKIGFVEGGPKTVVDALIKAVGEKGNLLMPTSPNSGLQLEYIKALQVFDVANDKSKLGAISEYFRNLPNSLRSAHPTEPVSCLGPDANFFTSTHFGEMTPYTAQSPFYKVSEKGGKILYLGVTLDNAGTNLHTLEDAIKDFKFPVYTKESFEIEVKFPNGDLRSMRTYVHNPEQSAKRKCDGLIPLFIDKGVLLEKSIGKARTLVVDAKSMLNVMIEEYKTNGVTMYTPKGK
ncbi:MAG: AAC(3) family N-acetyltransferase [Crocinitomicaceae bacterium]|nr:AAC(3) family N-acetyltransferase [Crocinitomicaceae bacterium]